MSFDALDSCLGAIIAEGQAELQTGPFGTMLRAEEYSGEGAPVISVGEIREGYLEIGSKTPRVSDETIARLPRFLLRQNDIVFGRKGSTHRNALIKKEEEGFFLGSDGIRLRVNSESICPKYLSYQLRSARAVSWLKANSEGTTMPSLNQDILSRFPVTLLPIADQKAIAHILGTLDDKIELNHNTNATLEAMAKALFKSWFVDFDPVRAKAEGRPTGLPAEISDLFPDSFEDSELGEIPSGWEIGRLEQILEIDPPRQLRKGSISPYLEMKGVPTRGHSALDVIGREFSSGSKFRNGDTLLARITPCLENGKTAFVDFLEDGEIGWGSTEFIVMCGRRQEINPFVYYLARSEGFRNNAIQNMVGSSGRQRVPSDAVSGFAMTLPPEEILVKFGLLATDLMRGISANADQSAILSKIRDALLPKLISGEIRIPDAEKMLEEVGV